MPNTLASGYRRPTANRTRQVTSNSWAPITQNESPLVRTHSRACCELYSAREQLGVLIRDAEPHAWYSVITYPQLMPADSVVVEKSDVADVYCVMS